MPNFGLIYPVGGPSRPLSAFMQDCEQERAGATKQMRNETHLAARQRATGVVSVVPEVPPGWAA